MSELQDKVRALIEDEDEFVTRVPKIVKQAVVDEGIDLQALVEMAIVHRNLLTYEVDGTALITEGLAQASASYNMAMAKLGHFFLDAIESGLECQIKNAIPEPAEERGDIETFKDRRDVA